MGFSPIEQLDRWANFASRKPRTAAAMVLGTFVFMMGIEPAVNAISGDNKSSPPTKQLDPYFAERLRRLEPEPIRFSNFGAYEVDSINNGVLTRLIQNPNGGYKVFAEFCIGQIETDWRPPAHFLQPTKSYPGLGIEQPVITVGRPCEDGHYTADEIVPGGQQTKVWDFPTVGSSPFPDL